MKKKKKKLKIKKKKKNWEIREISKRHCISDIFAFVQF